MNMIYEIELDDGNIYEIEAPDGTSEQQLIQTAARHAREARYREAFRDRGGPISNFTKGIGAGAVGFGEMAALGGATLLPEEWETPTRDAIKGAADWLRPEVADPDSVFAKLGQGVGSIAALLPTAFIPGGWALPTAGALAAGAGAGEASERARAFGTDEATRTGSALQGSLVGLTEVFTIARLARSLGKPMIADVLEKLSPAEIRGIQSRIQSAAATGGFEAAQEVTANTLQNLIETKYNPEAGLMDDNLESAWVGGGSGAIVQALVDVFAGGRRARGTTGDTTPQTEEERLGLPSPSGATMTPLAEPVTAEDGSVITTQEELDAYTQKRQLREQDLFPFELDEALAAEPVAVEQKRTPWEEQQFILGAAMEQGRRNRDVAPEQLDMIEQAETAQIEEMEAAPAIAAAQEAERAAAEQAQRRDAAETREIQALVNRDEQAAAAEAARAELARRQREQQANEDWALAEGNMAQEEAYSGPPVDNAGMETAIPERTAPPAEQFGLPGVPGQKAARKAGAVAPEPSQPIMTTVTDPETGEVTRELVPAELDYDEYIARERAITPELFDSMAVNKNAGIRKRFQGRDLSDPAVRAELAEALGSFITNRFSSRVARERAPDFLRGLKQAFGDNEQLGLFGPNRGPTNEARNFGRDKPRPRPAAQESQDAQAEAEVTPPDTGTAGVAAEAAPRAPAEPERAGPAPVEPDETQGGGDGPESSGRVDSEQPSAADTRGATAPEEGAVGSPEPVVPAAADRTAEQPGALSDTGDNRRKLERLRKLENIVKEDIDDAEFKGDEDALTRAQAELAEVEREIEQLKGAAPKAEAKPAPAPKAEPKAAPAPKEPAPETPAEPETGETGKTGKPKSELDVEGMGDIEGDQGAFLERLGQPLSYLQPNDPSQPSDVETVNALLQGGAPTKGTSAQKLGALIYFGRMQRPIDALREIAYTVVYGKPAKDGAAPRNRFEKGTPDEVKAFFEDKNQVTARAANEWAGLNLSDTLRSQLNGFLSLYRNAEIVDASRGKERKVAAEAKSKRQEEFQRRLDADIKRFEKLVDSADGKTERSSLKDDLDRGLAALTTRRMQLETDESKGIPRRGDLQELAEIEARLELAIDMEADAKWVDEFGRPVTKRQHIQNLLDELTGLLPLENDAMSASAVPLHPYVLEKLAAGDVAAALRAVAMSHPNGQLAQIAGAMANAMGDTSIVLKDGISEEYGAAGFFDPETNTITLDSSVGTNTHALMHEAGHALTAATLANPSHPVTKQLNKLYEDTREYLAGQYAVRSLDEFVVEAQSNPDFRRQLDQINIDGTKISAWQKFRNIVGNMLRRLAGFPTKDISTAKDKIDYLVDEILAPAPGSRPAPILKMEYDDIAAEVTKTPQSPAQAKRAMDKIADSIGARMKGPVAEKTIDTVHEFFSSKAPGLSKRVAFGLLPLYPITDMAKRYFPHSAPKMLELVRKYTGEVNKAYKEVGEGIIGPVKDWALKNPEKYRQLGDLLIHGDNYGVDLMKGRGRYKNNPEKAKEFDEMKAKYDKMDTDTQQQYRTVRATYDKIYDDILAQIKGKIASVSGDKELATSLYNSFYQKLTEKGGFDGYFPRQREGDWTLKYFVKTPNGQEQVFTMFKTERERDRAAEIVGRDENTVGEPERGKKFDLAKFEGSDPSTFLGGVMQTLNAYLDSADPHTTEVKEQIMRLAVEMSPQGSIARSLAGRKQEYIRGFDTNVMKVFTESVMRLKRREINLRFGAEFIALRRELKEEAKERGHYKQGSDHSGVLFENELRQRMDFAINPTLPTWSHNVRSAAYGWTLGFNPSSALIDMAAIPMIIQPMLAGQFTGQSAWRAINDARKLFMGSGRVHNIESMLTAGLEGAELKAMQDKLGILGRQMVAAKAFNSFDNYDFSDPNLDPSIRRHARVVEMAKEQGQIQRFSVFDDLDAIGEGNRLAKLNAYQGAMMQASERTRRELSLIAYNIMGLDKALAEGKEITPELETEIAQQAIDFTELTSGGNSSLATARFAQGKSGIGAVVMMYKRYGATMMYMQGKLLHDMLKGETPEIRAMARRQAAWVMGQSALWAGAMGMPMMGILAAIFDTFKDEEDDDFRTMIAKGLGDWGTYGLLDNLTGMSISQRVALTDMLLRYDPNTADMHPSEFLLQTIGGPAYGSAEKVWRGASQMAEGNLYRGFEQMLPTTVGNAFKSVRYALAGANTVRGDPIMDDVAPQSVFGQFLGFAPAELNKVQRFITMQKLADKARSRSRTRAFDKLYMAQQQGDTAGYLKALEGVAEHNERYPEVPIDGGDIQRSKNIRDRINQTRMLGVVPGDPERWRQEQAEMGLGE